MEAVAVAMAFECVHCEKTIEDDALKVPRSGAVCPHCKHDPTEGWSPYVTDVAEAGRKLADEMNLRLLIQEPPVQDAALWFLEDLVMERRHEVSIRLGAKPGVPQKCSVCGADVPLGEGFRIEFYDRWRATYIVVGLCETHLQGGLFGREFDTHMNHP
ncbi:MAG TPA: hypothetical protein VI759_05020, partial [Dehalococcoidia bacterium]|nr:hypothetical protein [Dehalococcoidia bacterium]